MKHAYLIIAHNEPVVLKYLLVMLDDERNDIFLHIDRRADDLYHLMVGQQLQHSRLFVLENRRAVHWGDISQVEVEYLLFETALKQGPYAYYHLLSGVDLPIKSQDYIHRFFQDNFGREFVGFWWEKSHRRDLHRKVQRYYLFTSYLKEGSLCVHGATAFIRNMVLAFQKAVSYRRCKSGKFCKGFQWVSITQDLCAYLVSEKPRVLRQFRYTLCPDEIFIQTMVWNSKFRYRLYNSEDVVLGSMRAIDWHRGNPYVWREEDEEALLNSPCLFARKFSEEKPQVIKRLYQKLKGKKSIV